MEEYKHGIYTSRKTAELPTPDKDMRNGVAVIGTAPVNLAVAPAVNRVVAACKKSEADATLGATEDFENYTLMHSVYAHFNLFGSAPVVFINVLDPENDRHMEAVTGEDVKLVGKMGTIAQAGIFLDKLTLSGEGGEFVPGKDYVASFDDAGHVTICATDDGSMAELDSVSASYAKLKPSGVTAADIIGGVDEMGVRTGAELLDEVYPRTGIIPSIIIAPGFSKDPAVAAVLETKAQLIYDLTNAEAFVDLDSSSEGADTKEKVREVKEKNVVSSRWNTPVWPMAMAGGHKIWGSALVAAMYQHSAVQNGGIPSSSASNQEAKIDGMCLEDGTELFLTERQVNDYVNAHGVVSFLRLPEWKLWGNNTAAYPAKKSPMDRFTKSVLMVNFMENVFKTEYMGYVDRNVDARLIQDVVNNFNIYLNSLTPDHLAGGSVVFDSAENPTENIAAGHLKFHTRYADYSPAEAIEHEFEYDISIYKDVLEGGEE
ncbi:MAG: hypothetical protein HFH62_04550 [Lachnospiraceae bacterium]|nr:hypothetical protein [Lachnospiraceae bacterium]